MSTARCDGMSEEAGTMTIAEYVKWTDTTAKYGYDADGIYVELGLFSELGEVAGVLKRVIRDQRYDLDKLKDELGDCLWYLARMYQLEGQWQFLNMYTDAPDRSLLVIAATHTSGKRRIEAVLALAWRYGFGLDNLIAANVAKLVGRKLRGTIHGSGDGR